MNSNRPYLIRAVYEWIVDNSLTPHILVDANQRFVEVPLEFVEEGQIILNISPSACKGLYLGVDRIIFTATFSGIPHQIYLPPSSILAIYAQENGKGIYLTKDEDGPSNFNSVSSYGRTNFMEDRKPKIEQRAKKERVKLTLVDSEPKEY